MLRHSESGYYFNFHQDQGIQSFNYSPGRDSSTHVDGAYDWNGVLLAFREWLQLLKAELNAPDLWSLISSQPNLLGSSSDPIAKEIFTADEKVHIQASIRELKEYIVGAQELNKEHTRFVEEQLEYLVSASDRVTKKDFLLIAFSTVIQIALVIGMDAEAARRLIDVASSALSWITEHMPKLVR